MSVSIIALCCMLKAIGYFGAQVYRGTPGVFARVLWGQRFEPLFESDIEYALEACFIELVAKDV